MNDQLGAGREVEEGVSPLARAVNLIAKRIAAPELTATIVTPICCHATGRDDLKQQRYFEKRQAVMAFGHDCGMPCAAACRGTTVHCPPKDGQPHGDGVWHFGAERW
ncbi:hypothetical protein [Aquabacterium sp. CECT 9606]|uniref:hypothetical protein n=1 Tax=Aquabacterium sp. CECT 9606 TaxID=2845822 RepID=UPI001E32F8C4|nr:hypothetical protein [Aquabacterium sp. CECT 9606]